MNTTDPRSIARGIRRTLKLHERTQRKAIRLPDEAASIVADALEHYAATLTDSTHYAIYERPAVMWMTAAQHLAGELSLTERQAIDRLEQWCDDLLISPSWRQTRKGNREGRYLTLTGSEIRRVVRYGRKQGES